jgi:hypothetical protein
MLFRKVLATRSAWHFYDLKTYSTAQYFSRNYNFSEPFLNFFASGSTIFLIIYDFIRNRAVKCCTVKKLRKKYFHFCRSIQ